MGDDQGNPAPNRDPGDETQCDIFGDCAISISGPAFVTWRGWAQDDPLQPLRDAADESEPEDWLISIRFGLEDADPTQLFDAVEAAVSAVCPRFSGLVSMRPDDVNATVAKFMPDERDAEITRLRAENEALQGLLVTHEICADRHLSSGWHHLPCVTAGIPDKRAPKSGFPHRALRFGIQDIGLRGSS